MSNLVKRVQNTIFQQKLFSRGVKIILAVSGGPDSVCLLDIYKKLEKTYDLSLIVAHVNYDLRGKESEKDKNFVKDLSEKYGFRFFVLKPRVKKNCPENELREIRYDFFEKLRIRHQFDLISVAHNLDDQVETFLMRIIRGAGLLGLSAIRYKNGRIIRPLLGTTRKEILAYLQKNKLDFQTDKTNLESKFLRNRIRNQLIPYLRKNFNPEISKTIFNATRAISDDYDLLEKISQENVSRLKSLNVPATLKLHPSIQKRIILAAIKEKKLDLKNIESAHIEEIIKVLQSTKSKRQTVFFKGLKVTRRGDKLEVTKIKK